MQISARKVTKWSIIFSFIFLAGIFVPSLIGLDGFDGGFAIIFLCIVAFLTSAITAIVFWRQAKREKAIRQGDGVIARWQYSPQEWQSYTEYEYKIDKANKKMLFYVVAGIAGACAVIFPIFDHENGFFVSYVMIGLIALIGFVAWLSIKLAYIVFFYRLSSRV